MNSEVKIKGNKIIVEIPADYLIQHGKMAITYGAPIEVIEGQETAMLEFFKNEIESCEDDSLFGQFIDSVFENAIDQAEEWLVYEDEE